MTKAKIVGKQHFTSKDGDDYYKITILEPMTDRQKKSGCVGLQATDYFIDVTLYHSLDGVAIQKFADFNIDFAVANGRAAVVSAVVA